MCVLPAHWSSSVSHTKNRSHASIITQQQQQRAIHNIATGESTSLCCCCFELCASLNTFQKPENNNGAAAAAAVRKTCNFCVIYDEDLIASSYFIARQREKNKALGKLGQCARSTLVLCICVSGCYYIQDKCMATHTHKAGDDPVWWAKLEESAQLSEILK